MEKRKIQRVGRNTLTISLPYWWAAKYELGPGDFLSIEEDSNGVLKLWPQKMDTGQSFRSCSINADVCKKSGFLQRLITASYISGVDVIEVYSTESLGYTSVREIRRAMKSLMGMSIMKEERQRVILQCLLDVLNLPIHSLLRRLYDLSASMYEESIQALLNKNRELAKMVIVRDEEVNKMYYLLLRALSVAQRSREISESLGIKDPSIEIPHLRSVGYCIETMADWSKFIAKGVLRILACDVVFDATFAHKFEKYHELCREVSREGVESFFSRDLELANEAIRKYQEELEIKEGEVLASVSYNSAKCESNMLCPHFTCVIWGVRRQAELGVEIAEISINMNLKSRPDIIQLGIVSDLKVLEE